MYSTKPPASLSTPPPTSFAELSFPAPKVLLVTLNRPKDLNCINSHGNAELGRIWNWLDEEDGLTVGVLTGRGRAFCAGADLKEWNSNNSNDQPRPIPPSGFGSLSRRTGRKPIILAVNGICYGGGCEMLINSDMALASASATIALPEVKRGVVALAGALPRLVRTVGKQRAMEMALTGRTVSAEEAYNWGLINKIVPGGAEEVVKEAVKVAESIAANSPDAVIVSREGVKMGWEGVGADDATRIWMESWYPRLVKGENMAEGVMAFVQKRKPEWKPSKL